MSPTLPQPAPLQVQTLEAGKGNWQSEFPEVSSLSVMSLLRDGIDIYINFRVGLLAGEGSQPI